MSDGCYVGLQQELERLDNLKRLEAERYIEELRLKIYKFLAEHDSKALHNKRITLRVPLKSLEAKELGDKKE